MVVFQNVVLDTFLRKWYTLHHHAASAGLLKNRPEWKWGNTIAITGSPALSHCLSHICIYVCVRVRACGHACVL